MQSKTPKVTYDPFDIIPSRYILTHGYNKSENMTWTNGEKMGRSVVS